MTERRAFIAGLVATGTVAIAGCVGGDDDTTGDDSDPDTQTNNGDETTDTDEQEPEITVLEIDQLPGDDWGEGETDFDWETDESVRFWWPEDRENDTGGVVVRSWVSSWDEDTAEEAVHPEEGSYFGITDPDSVEEITVADGGQIQMIEDIDPNNVRWDNVRARVRNHDVVGGIEIVAGKEEVDIPRENLPIEASLSDGEMLIESMLFD